MTEEMAGLGDPFERAWIRIPEETDASFRCYQIYRSLGSDRTLETAAKLYYGERWEGGIRTVETWSSRHDWVDRVRLHDDQFALQERQIREKLRTEHVGNHASIREEIFETLLRTSLKAAKTSEKMIDWPISTQERIVDGPDGEEVTLIVNPAGWSKNTALGMMNMAMAAITGSLKNIEQPAEESPIEVVLDNLSDEEVETLLELDSKMQIRRRED